MADVSRAYASLDLTHVIYDASSHLSLLLALLTLSPILLMPAYAVLAVQTRELTIINMWAGQLLSEVLNLVVKHIVKEERPADSELRLNGYGFPSSHSQYMGFFAMFLYCHMFFRHRFASTGYPILDQLFRVVVYVGITAWTGVVAYSRLHLQYHAHHQVYWGLGIGAALAVVQYTFTEYLPVRFPNSICGRARTAVLANPISSWLGIRDGWAVYSDGGRDAEWRMWKEKWDAQRRAASDKRQN